jgi:putative (di)nucleoside polyphosphate hydrolase
MSVSDDLRPYRPNAGVALFNAQGLVLIAKRFRDDGPEIILPGHEWQMPQGGIDSGEQPLAAARRELFEETGVTRAELLGETRDWLSYDFPPYQGSERRLARFRGQRQKWFAFRFLGSDGEIDVTSKRTEDDSEFEDWRWERLDRVAALVVPFRRQVYEQVAREFQRFASPELKTQVLPP